MSKILILGAGASYGHQYNYFPKPPLANHFFSSNNIKKYKDIYTPLFEYLKNWASIDVSNNDETDIEHVYGLVEAGWRLKGYGVQNWDEVEQLYGSPFFFISPLELLQSYIIDILSQSTSWLSQNNLCPTHATVANRWLEDGDAIISFNYDLIMDSALNATEKWSLASGYGWDAQEAFRSKLDQKKSAVKLFKLHGSLNWFADSSQKDIFQEVREIIKVASYENAWGLLRKSPFFKFTDFDYENFNSAKNDAEKTGIVFKKQHTFSKSPFTPLLVFPTPYKPLDLLNYGQLKKVWRGAEDAIEKSNEIFSCGFSFRDSHFNQILREVAIKRKRILNITVITKDETSFNQIKETFSGNDKLIQIQRFNGWLQDFIGA